MNSNRLNLIGCVRASLIAGGYSTVQVVNAVNAELGRLEAGKVTEKLGAGSVSKKAFSVTETVSTKYSGKITIPLRFDAWHSAIERANKVAEMDSVAIPAVFNEWLQSMKAEKVETPA